MGGWLPFQNVNKIQVYSETNNTISSINDDVKLSMRERYVKDHFDLKEVDVKSQEAENSSSIDSECDTVMSST